MPCNLRHSRTTGRAGPHTNWGYEAGNGPEHWASLDPEFSLCAVGSEQSPIDLKNWVNADVPPVEFSYGPTGVTVENTGHTIQVNPQPGHGIGIGTIHYELQQFHFHHGSEHLVDGRRFPLELHLVHRSESGAIAVIGVLFGPGSSHHALEPVWAQLDVQPGDPRVVADAFDLRTLIPARHTTWRYRGSLTTPPCSEGVDWVILSIPLSMSAEQLARFADMFPNNYRPVQPLGDRTLKYG